jgi:hypothetical protein
LTKTVEKLRQNSWVSTHMLNTLRLHLIYIRSLVRILPVSTYGIRAPRTHGKILFFQTFFVLYFRKINVKKWKKWIRNNLYRFLHSDNSKSQWLEFHPHNQFSEAFIKSWRNT